MRAIEEVKADVQNTSLDGYAWPHEKNFENGRYDAVNWIITRAHEIDASTPEQTDEARDAARLESGCITDRHARRSWRAGTAIAASRCWICRKAIDARYERRGDWAVRDVGPTSS